MSKRISTSLLTLLAFPGAASAADLPSLKRRPPRRRSSLGRRLSGSACRICLNTISEQATDLVPATPALEIRWRLTELFGARPLTAFRSVQ